MRDYKKLPPFKYFCLTNFPYIEADFDALTNYQLLCKIVGYINLMSDKVNEQEDIALDVKAQVIALKKRLDDFIADLDIQDAVNDKLDAMAESGELAELLRLYLGETAEIYVKGVWTSIQNVEGTSPAYPYSYMNLAVVKFGDKVLLMDSGYRYIPADESNLTESDLSYMGALADEVADWFSAIEVTHIDYVYISHYDYDHASGLSLIATLNNNTMLKEATIYLPQTPVFAKVEGTSVPRWYYEIEALVVSENMVKIIPTALMNEFDLTALLKIRFYNTDHSSYYESVDFDYNNCSLCACLINGNVKIFDAGDINLEAQHNIASGLEHFQLVMMAHHGTNIKADEEYIRYICPDIYLAQNGNGRSVSGALDYLNRYSYENDYAQKRGLNVFATSNSNMFGSSEAPDYTMHFYFNSFGIVFTTGNIRNKKTFQLLNGVSDASGSGSAVNVNIPAQSFLDDMLPANSMNVFSLSGSYHLTPIVNTGSWLEILFKTISGNTSNVFEYEEHNPYYGLGIYSDNKYGASSDLVAVRFGRYDNQDNSDFSLANLLSCAYHKFEKSEGDVTLDSNWTKYAFDNEPFKFGDNFELVLNGDHAGEILCNNTGVYKITLTSQTRVGLSGTTSYCHYQLRNASNENIVARTIHYFNPQPTYSSDTDMQYITAGTYLKLVHLGGNYTAHDYVSVLIEEMSHIQKISKDNFYRDAWNEEA